MEVGTSQQPKPFRNQEQQSVARLAMSSFVALG